MSKPNKKKPKGHETTILNFNKFTSKQPGSLHEESGTSFIKRAADETVQQAKKRVVVPSSAGSLAAEEMLGAVAYCYAKGVYSSSDIERKMMQDPEFRKALGGVVPDPQGIRRFRRLNRPAIQEVLEKFYRRRRKQMPPKPAVSGAQPPDLPAASPGEPGHAALAGSNPGIDTALVAKREATERLDKATFTDCISEDD